MAVNVLVSGTFDATDQNAYTTAAFTPTAGALVIALFLNRHGTSANTVTISTTTDLSFGSAASQASASGTTRVTRWAAVADASPTNGTVTFTVDTAQTATIGGWCILEITDGVQIIQSPGGAETDTTFDVISMSAFTRSTNLCILFLGSQGTATLSEEGTWTVDANTSGTPPATAMLVAHKVGDSTPTATASASSVMAGLGLEVSLLVASGPHSATATGVATCLKNTSKVNLAAAALGVATTATTWIPSGTAAVVGGIVARLRRLGGRGV